MRRAPSLSKENPGPSHSLAGSHGSDRHAPNEWIARTRLKVTPKNEAATRVNLWKQDIRDGLRRKARLKREKWHDIGGCG